MAEHIIFCGKGGVGTSTLVSNISAALTEAGFKIMQVGCDHRGDSCSMLNSGVPITTAGDFMRGTGRPLADVVQYGFKGVALLEIGSHQPESGLSDAAGVGRIYDALEQEQIFERSKADYVLHDMSAAGGFETYHEIFGTLGAARIFVVTNADFKSLSAANSIFESLERLVDSRTAIPCGGLIPNGIGSSFEDSFIADFAGNTATYVLGRVPRSLMVRQCELYGRTVIEAAPLSNQSYFYRRVANQITDIARTLPVKTQPKAMTSETLRTWAHEWADRLHALENGLVTDGAAI